MTHTAYIALGSNLGRREDFFLQALTRLRLAGVHVAALSSSFETDPVGGPPGQGKYLNAAARLETSLPPRQFLNILLNIENELGRQRLAGLRNGPRTIDLDLLLYGDLIENEPGLILPHPRMHERIFVLEPLAEVGGDARHPLLKRTVREMLCDARNTVQAK